MIIRRGKSSSRDLKRGQDEGTVSKPDGPVGVGIYFSIIGGGSGGAFCVPGIFFLSYMYCHLSPIFPLDLMFSILLRSPRFRSHSYAAFGPYVYQVHSSALS